MGQQEKIDMFGSGRKRWCHPSESERACRSMRIKWNYHNSIFFLSFFVLFGFPSYAQNAMPHHRTMATMIIIITIVVIVNCIYFIMAIEMKKKKEKWMRPNENGKSKSVCDRERERQKNRMKRKMLGVWKSFNYIQNSWWNCIEEQKREKSEQQKKDSNIAHAHSCPTYSDSPAQYLDYVMPLSQASASSSYFLSTCQIRWPILVIRSASLHHQIGSLGTCDQLPSREW